MRKIFLISSFFLMPLCVMADAYNPFFGDNKHQIMLNVGTGVNSGFIVPPPEQFVPYNMFQTQYSIPATFFNLPARQTIGIATNVGHGEKYGWHWNDYTIPIAFISGDAILFHGKKWYTGTGIAIGFQAKENERIGSKLLFGFKLLAGYRLSEHWNGEFFIQHFSNGNCATENHSYAFYGLGASYSF